MPMLSVHLPFLVASSFSALSTLPRLTHDAFAFVASQRRPFDKIRSLPAD